MIWVFAALSAISTFVIAAVAVGGATASLASRPRRSVYDLDEAVEVVADSLSDEVTATVGYDDVQVVLTWYVSFLARKGVASTRTADEVADGLVVVPEDELLGWILGRVDAASDGEPGSGLTDAEVVAILEANASYERSVGVIGAAVAGPEGLD